MTTSVVLAILVTSLATFSSRFLGVITSEKIKENSKIFRWFNCLAYSTLAALIARIIIFPSGVLSEVDYLVRFIVIILSILIFYLTKKNLVYPTIFSAIVLALINSYFVWKNPCFLAQNARETPQGDWKIPSRYNHKNLLKFINKKRIFSALANLVIMQKNDGLWNESS